MNTKRTFNRDFGRLLDLLRIQDNHRNAIEQGWWYPGEDERGTIAVEFTPPLSNRLLTTQSTKMATLNISQDDALKGFKAASDINSGLGGENPLSNLKNYVLGSGPSTNTGLPFAYKDPQHTSTTSNDTPFMSWPTWASLSTQTPWYETLGLSRTQRYAAFGLCIAAASLLLMIVLLFGYLCVS